jgi:hypothetical protein
MNNIIDTDDNLNPNMRLFNQIRNVLNEGDYDETFRTTFSARIENIYNLLKHLGKYNDHTIKFNIDHIRFKKYIGELKNTKLYFSGIAYSYYHLCKLNLSYKNKYNIMLKPLFYLGIHLNKIIYKCQISIINKERICLGMNCLENNCNGKTHLVSESNQILIVLESPYPNILLDDVEKKLHDYNICIECHKYWDIQMENRYIDENQSEEDSEDFDTCDECHIRNHFNSKTLIIMDKCSICLKDIYENSFYETSCGHLFHPKCINIWFENKKTCPLCRHNMCPESTIPVIVEPIIMNIDEVETIIDEVDIENINAVSELN